MHDLDNKYTMHLHLFWNVISRIHLKRTAITISTQHDKIGIIFVACSNSVHISCLPINTSFHVTDVVFIVDMLMAMLEKRVENQSASSTFGALLSRMQQICSQALKSLTGKDVDESSMNRIHQNLNALEKLIFVALKSPADLTATPHLSYGT